MRGRWALQGGRGAERGGRGRCKADWSTVRRGGGALARAREAVRGRGGLAGRRALDGGRGEEGRGRLCGMGEGGAWFKTLIFLLSASASRDGGGCGGR